MVCLESLLERNQDAEQAGLGASVVCVVVLQCCCNTLWDASFKMCWGTRALLSVGISACKWNSSGDG